MAKIAEKEALPARERIIWTAFELFHDRGIHAASVDDILKESGTGKSQFYHYFGSKEGLIHAMLQEIRRMFKEGEIPGYTPIETWEDLRAWFDNALEKQESYGCARACPIGQIGAELAEENELIRQDVELIFDAMKDYPKEFFIKLKARGELPEEADPDALGDLCIAALQGGALYTKVRRDNAPSRHTLDHVFQYLRSMAQ